MRDDDIEVREVEVDGETVIQIDGTTGPHRSRNTRNIDGTCWST